MMYGMGECACWLEKLAQPSYMQTSSILVKDCEHRVYTYEEHLRFAVTQRIRHRIVSS